MAELEISQTILVFPTPSPFSTPSQTKTLHLSHLDTDRNLDVAVRTVRLYENSQQFNNITRALSLALSNYYPLAGTLQRRRESNRLTVHCAAGQGVPVTHAASRQNLAFFGDVVSPVVDGLVPDPPVQDMLAQPLRLQVTFFACGGFSVGMCVHHSLCDGAGATQFLGAVAEIVRGAAGVSVPPVWARDGLLGPRRPPKVGVDFSPFLSVGRIPDMYEGGGLAREVFHVSEEGLKRLRDEMPGFTSFEAVVAFIWRARVKASKVAPFTKVNIVFSMDVRRLLRPSLPAGYWGNGCVPVYSHTTAGELLQKPLKEIADLIRQSKRAVTVEYVQSFIDFQELHYAEGITVRDNTSGFTDWRNLDHTSLDFGSGGPISVLPLSFKLLGCLDLCFLLPFPSVSGVKKGGFRALVSIALGMLPEFRAEMKSLGET